MKRMYRIVSTILALVFVLSSVSTVAIAAKKPTITIDTVSANPGDTVKVEVKISGNTGVAGALLKISYDSKLSLTGAENGDAFSKLTFTKSGNLSNPAKFLWDSESGMTKKDGTILILTFKVAENTEKGTDLNISASCKSGDFYDVNMDTVEVSIVNGGVNIANEANNNLSVFDTIIASIKNVIAIIIKFFKNIF